MWNEIIVYYNKKYLGRIHTKMNIKRDIKKLIDGEFGIGNWNLCKFIN